MAVRASDSLEDVFAQLEEASKSGAAEQAAPAEPAVVEPAVVEPVVMEVPAEPVVMEEPMVDEAVAEAPAAEVVAETPAVEVPVMTGADVEAAPVVSAKPAKVLSQQDALYEKAKSLYRAGEYDMAEVVFEAMLANDPYDMRASDYLKRTAKKIGSKELRKLGASRAEAMKDVAAAWNPTPKSGDDLINVTRDRKDLSGDEQLIREMEARLKSIIIPSLDFRDANIKDVVLFLSDTCRRLDAEGRGVNILLLGVEGKDVDPAVAAQATANNITISIRDMNLYDSLQYITEMASLKFEVEPNVVSISPINYVKQKALELRSYDIIPEVGADMESLSGGAADAGGGADDLFGASTAAPAGGGSGGPLDVTGFFSVVDFPTGTSATYQPRFHKLFVKNTPKNLQMLEGILSDLADEAIKKRSQQVEIEAKFVEFNEGALDELGFNWTLYSDGSVGGFKLEDQGSYYAPSTGWKDSSANAVNEAGVPSTILTDPIDGATKILSNPGQSLFGSNQRNNTTAYGVAANALLSSMGGTPAAMVFSKGGSFPVGLRITAMQREGTADVLSAPKVTTKSGNEAIIRAVEVHRYPQDYDVETGQRTAPVVKPQDWEDYDLGVVLKVTPVVDAESNTIDLDLMPSITKFLGWDDYVVGYNSYAASGNNSDNSAGDGSTLIAQMPYFETRTVQTQVTVADGSTVLMGGLVNEITETFSDRVPILGDIPYLGILFRTDGERSSKKNLVIYVKATQVDDRGYTREDRENVKAINQSE
ncbi:MAG: hypothetical protein K9M45_06710 [Kiritimatiellales bacterium]|nr:hypothetical protein [Kiritimatiellales bacterium]